MKYLVKAVRRETYVVDIEVEADSFSQAEEMADEMIKCGDSDFFGEIKDADEWIESIAITPDWEVRDPCQGVE